MKLYGTLSIMVLTLFLSYSGNRQDEYQQFQNKLDAVESVNQIESSGFEIVSIQVFDVDFPGIGANRIIPAIDGETKRIVLFFASGNHIVYATEDLYCNKWFEGIQQYNYEIPGTAFRDLNGDGLLDIVMVSLGFHDGDRFKVGDVLFQEEGGFYRDWRISDQLNRYSMNIDFEMVYSFVREGQSTEFLYTAATVDELIEKGFKILDNRLYESIFFENFGEVDVVFGYYPMGGHFIFMVYILAEDGSIIWNLQPMEGHDNFSTVRKVSFEDINGDGLKDISFTARFDNLIEEDGEFFTESTDEYVIYCQDKNGFYRLRRDIFSEEDEI